MKPWEMIAVMAGVWINGLWVGVTLCGLADALRANRLHKLEAQKEGEQ